VAREHWCSTVKGVARRDGAHLIPSDELWSAEVIRAALATTEQRDHDDLREALRISRRIEVPSPCCGQAARTSDDLAELTSNPRLATASFQFAEPLSNLLDAFILLFEHSFQGEFV
jgi:hypothetical protein